MRRRLPRLVLLPLALSLALAACAGASSPSTGTIRADGAWARASMGMDRAGAAYVTLINETGLDDALLGASSTAAGTVEIHETMAGASGTMAMHPVDRIALSKGATVELKPGGYHVMLIGLTKALTVGDTIRITLRFEHAPELVIDAPVKAG